MKSLKKLIVLLFAYAITYSAMAQQQPLNDHHHFLNQLVNAKDSLYQEILARFDSHILSNPKDVKAQLEKCKVIEKAYYDSYEDYNPNYDQAKACASEVVERFPENPEALLYQTEFVYGDSLIAALENLRELAEQNEDIWKDHSWKVYKRLAEEYQYKEDHEKSAKFGELAVTRNDTLDMSLLLAKAYKNLDFKIKAVDVLLNHLDSTDQPYFLNQKGKLLLELGVPDKAMEAFRMSGKKDSDAEDAGALAQAMIDNGLWAEARPYLLKASSSNYWNHDGLQKLMEYDLKYSSGDSSHASYSRYVSANFWNDPVGIYRIRLTWKSPSSGWSLQDVGRILLLFALVIVIFLIPYLWVLPIHYYGTWQRQRGKIFPDSTFQWGLRHFWLICSLWLFCDIAAFIIFDYNGFISMFNDSIGVAQEIEPVSKHEASFTLFFFISTLIFTMAFLKNEDIVNFIPKMKASISSIGTGIGLAFVLKIGLGIYAAILNTAGLSLAESSSVTASITESIISINKFYNPYLGFLLVVVLVPFYEEILFRGIFLSACERNMRFVYANILQSVVFALVHQSLMLFVFYFAFGMIAGYYRQKSQGLIISTSMHMMNNLIAFTAITLRS